MAQRSWIKKAASPWPTHPVTISVPICFFLWQGETGQDTISSHKHEILCLHPASIHNFKSIVWSWLVLVPHSKMQDAGQEMNSKSEMQIWQSTLHWAQCQFFLNKDGIKQTLVWEMSASEKPW